MKNKYVSYKKGKYINKVPLQIRLQIVRRYNEIGNITQITQEFQTTRKTIRK